MKYFAFWLVIILIGPPVSAATLQDFTGKYKIGKCDVLAWSQNAEVHVRLDQDKAAEVSSLRIYVYFKDGGGTGESMVLGSETLTNPDFGRSNPVKAVETSGSLEGEKLVNTVSYIYGSGRKRVAYRKELEILKRGLIYRESSRGKTSRCRLVAN